MARRHPNSKSAAVLAPPFTPTHVVSGNKISVGTPTHVVSGDKNSVGAPTHVVGGDKDSVGGCRSTSDGVHLSKRRAPTSAPNSSVPSPPPESVPSEALTRAGTTPACAAAKAASECSDLLYSHVLVDAECTHDGSLKHLQRYQEQGEFYYELVS